MANYPSTKGLEKILRGEVAFHSDDLRIAMVMTDTTADTEEDAEFVGDLSTLDEYDGAGYARIPLANQSVNSDLVDDEAQADADDFMWSGLAAGSRDAAGLILYKHVTTDADSPFLGWIDTGGFPFSASGSDVTVRFHADGFYKLRRPV